SRWLVRTIGSFGRVQFIANDELERGLVAAHGAAMIDELDLIQNGPGEGVHWRQRAQDLIDNSTLVVFDLSVYSPGVVWEVAHVEKTIGFEMCLVLFEHGSGPAFERYLQEFPALKGSIAERTTPVVELGRGWFGRLRLTMALFDWTRRLQGIA
ncbi:MAG: hypothetical protein JNM69_02430, partial [Archangium sp.]|nr:hypothetical protein [Archangium sp.]